MRLGLVIAGLLMLAVITFLLWPASSDPVSEVVEEAEEVEEQADQVSVVQFRTTVLH